MDCLRCEKPSDFNRFSHSKKLKFLCKEENELRCMLKTYSLFDEFGMTVIRSNMEGNRVISPEELPHLVQGLKNGIEQVRSEIAILCS